jgi:hypothetical protein
VTATVVLPRCEVSASNGSRVLIEQGSAITFLKGRSHDIRPNIQFDIHISHRRNSTGNTRAYNKPILESEKVVPRHPPLRV